MLRRFFSHFFPRAACVAVLTGSMLLAANAHAALFEDDEARRAIIELRQRIDGLQQSSQRASTDLLRSGEDTGQMRRSLLDLQSQIENLRVEGAKLRGQNEQMVRELSELQQGQKQVLQNVDQRLAKIEPSKVAVDGQEFVAEPAEQSEYEAALASFRSGKFAEAQAAFAKFLAAHPRSGYVPSAQFWLGNAQYATRDYKTAIATFKTILATVPTHPRAPEAALSIANCQMELKEVNGARKTLEDLILAYPQAEAAAAAKERLSRMK